MAKIKDLETTRITLRLPVDVLERVDRKAKEQRITRNLYIRLQLAQLIVQEDKLWQDNKNKKPLLASR